MSPTDHAWPVFGPPWSLTFGKGKAVRPIHVPSNLCHDMKRDLGVYQIHTLEKSSCKCDSFLFLLTPTCWPWTFKPCVTSCKHASGRATCPRVCVCVWWLDALCSAPNEMLCPSAADINSGSRTCRRPAWSSLSTTKLARLCCEPWSGRGIARGIICCFVSAAFAFTRLPVCSVSWRKVFLTWSKRSFWLTTTAIMVSLHRKLDETSP